VLALHCLRKGVVTLNGKKLSIVSSILILLAAGLIVASLFYPWWAMKFIAPQYPEGLNIIVYPDKLKGEIDIVNGLNHYIGMSEFSEENFPELKYLKYLIGGLAALTVLTAILRRKALLYGLIGLFMIGGALGVWDLHRWLKNFGTKLDPMAPIKVDPFIPPIIGENTLANFITYSTLQPGTYFVIAAVALLLIPLWKDRKQ
jgi:copper chaperone NosL